MTIIEQLKANEKPFGLMSEEMQAKMLEMGFHGNFRLYVHPGFGGVIDNPTYKHDGCFTYRLRADYTEKPEIEECEIYKEKEYGFLRTRHLDNITMDIDAAPHYPDFIGFKCEGWIWGRAYKNKRTGIISIMIRADQLDGYEVCDMTQAHVLFRRQK